MCVSREIRFADALAESLAFVHASAPHLRLHVCAWIPPGELRVVGSASPAAAALLVDAVLARAACAELFRTLEQGHAVEIPELDDRCYAAATFERMKEDGARAVLMLPFHFEEQLAGAFVAAAQHPRRWTSADHALLADLARRVGPALAVLALARERESITREFARREMELGSLRLRARGAAHDTRNLLMVVDSHITSARRQADGDGVLRSLERAEHALAEIAMLQRDVFRAGADRSCDLSLVLDRMRGTLQSLAGPRVEVTVRTEGALGRIPLSDAEVLQVLVNLVRNAADALLPRGGHVSIHVVRQGERIVVSVTDDGPGIDGALRSRIFEPGVSSRGPTRGLGLALVKDVVRSCGGSVDIAPTVTGSRFVLDLPAEAQAESSAH